jgi:GNAT superfamily N-acetyltransferase
VTDIVIRAALPSEARQIVAHRRAMFAAMGADDPARLEAMSAAFAPWVAQKLASGEYVAWFAQSPTGEIIGGTGVWVMDWPPHILDTSPRRGNLLNVYVEPEHRRRGVARALVLAALDWCRSQRLGLVILHASEAGRPLYEALGFQASNEMRLSLPDAG